MILGNTYTTRWDRDAQDRLASMTYPSGLVLNYGYDGVGRVSSIASNIPGIATVASGAQNS